MHQSIRESKPFMVVAQQIGESQRKHEQKMQFGNQANLMGNPIPKNKVGELLKTMT